MYLDQEVARPLTTRIATTVVLSREAEVGGDTMKVNDYKAHARHK